jgi:hypothetical protein
MKRTPDKLMLISGLFPSNALLGDLEKIVPENMSLTLSLAKLNRHLAQESLAFKVSLLANLIIFVGLLGLVPRIRFLNFRFWL